MCLAGVLGVCHRGLLVLMGISSGVGVSGGLAWGVFE